MLSEFLKDYLPIILFLIIALGLSCAFVVVNFILSPKKPDPEKLSLMNVDLNHLKTLEWNLMFGFI
jgi:NADH:ubiquinone oxidoreductase subunit 3 (subunit A)